ncbi:DNA-protecting protein DprA [Candidatus Woesearchaeota archaeon]|nr:DNA-protecting protein DprA [Candidatus Woesearchaeota archaeon]
MENATKTMKLLAMRDSHGNKQIIDLIASYGSLDAAYENLFRRSVIRESHLKKSQDTMDFCRSNSIDILTYFDAEYPDNLRKLSSPPLVLFTKGDLGLLKMPSVSIVGTRIPSDTSLRWAYENAKELACLGYTIISGGALGIDASAHRGALDADGKTICILGSGLNEVYPKQNQQLIEKISSKGLVISEYLPNYHVNRISLLERNRITSGLGDKILIVATGISGGTMSQYKTALSQKKQIFCPSPILSLEPSEGIRQIIETNDKVRVITGIKEMLEAKDEPMTQKMIRAYA